MFHFHACKQQIPVRVGFGAEISIRGAAKRAVPAVFFSLPRPFFASFFPFSSCKTRHQVAAGRRQGRRVLETPGELDKALTSKL